MPSNLFKVSIGLAGVIAATTLVGCGAKAGNAAKSNTALLPPDRTILDVPPTPEQTQATQQQDVLPSQDDAVAALIRKSEAYAKELNQAKFVKPKEFTSTAPDPIPVMTQQITVKAPDPTTTTPPAPIDAGTNTSVVTSEATKPTPTVVADANNSVPMSTANANVVNDPPAAKVITPTQSFSSDVLEKKLLSRVKDYPRDVAGHLEYQMMLFLKDQQTPDIASLSALPEEDRELVAAVMDGLTNFRSQLRSDNNMLLSKKIRPMVDLSTRLQSQAELTVPTVALCTRVDGFGRYEPVEPARFAAGKATEIIVYCEVANFTSRMAGEKNLWQTDLTQDIVLYSEAGQPLWTDANPKIQDVSRVRRHDFFIRKLVTLPPTLQTGRYLLKVTVTDQQANRVAEASLPVQIVAK